jgi:alpha-glucosidase
VAAAYGRQCRDPERTPLQWTGDLPNAGFTGPAAQPWLPVSREADHINVAAAEADPNSMLNLTRRLLALRQTELCLHLGEYQAVDNPSPAAVFSFVRTCNRDSFFLVLVNFASEATVVDMTRWVLGERVTVALDALSPTAEGSAVDLRAVRLQARQALVLRTFHQPKGGSGSDTKTGSNSRAVVGAICGAVVVLMIVSTVLVANASKGGVTRLSIRAEASLDDPMTLEEEEGLLREDEDSDDEMVASGPIPAAATSRRIGDDDDDDDVMAVV